MGSASRAGTGCHAGTAQALSGFPLLAWLTDPVPTGVVISRSRIRCHIALRGDLLPYFAARQSALETSDDVHGFGYFGHSDFPFWVVVVEGFHLLPRM